MILSDVIAGVESSDNIMAMRFEPAMYGNAPGWAKNQLTYIHAANPWASPETGLMIASTSWGRYQILGANIYAFGAYNSPIAAFLASSSDQESVFHDFIGPHGYHPEDDTSVWNIAEFGAFAAFYNGPGAVDAYVAAMKRVMAGA